MTDCCRVRSRIYAGIVWKRSIRFWARGAKNAGNPWAVRKSSAGTAAERGTASTAVLRRTVTTGNLRFKYHERQEYAGFYAHAAFFYVGKQIQRRNPEVLVPVPLHPARQRQRGYNQAEVFAEKLAEEMELPMNARLIRRVKKTKRQKELGPAERRKNLEGAFALAKPGQMKYCRILLVDDIYTTGSTVDAIASLLKVNGAEQVDFVCAAIVK